MPTSKSVDRYSFLAALRESGLLTTEQLREAAGLVPESNRGRIVARALVARGWLTRFQAEQVLAGRTAGFSLGQYRILDLLGEGGMGRVFQAQHVTMNRVVALKVLTPSLLKTARAQELFLREVRLVAQLVHPNIVTAFDANQVNGRCFLVLEYIDGPNLDQLVRDRGPLPVEAACEIVRQVAIGLQFAHHKKMIHRDIKPANILILRSGADALGTVKISDFGLAGLQDAEGIDGKLPTRPNTVMGTPDFLSPEQARDIHSADIRSDLYSLGAMFYFLLTGELPFPGGSSMEKLVRHATSTPVPAEELRPDLLPEVAAIVRKLMSKNPADRYQTPTELATALTPFARSIPLNWPTTSATARSHELPAEDNETGDEAEHQLDASVLAGTVPPSLLPTSLLSKVGQGSGSTKSGYLMWAAFAVLLLAAAGSLAAVAIRLFLAH